MIVNFMKQTLAHLPMIRVLLNVLLFAVLAYIFMYLALSGYGVISMEVEEKITTPSGETPAPPQQPPPYHPDVIIYESQRSPGNPMKIPHILIAILVAFLIVYLAIKIGPKALKALIGFSMYVAAVYTLRGILHSLSVIYSFVMSLPLVALALCEVTPVEIKSIILAVVVGGIGALLGIMAYPILWIVILVALVAYDVWGVYKGPVKRISEEAIKYDIPLLIKIRAGDEEHFIGLGDYALPMSFLASLMKYESVYMSIVSFIGFISGTVLALIIVRRKGPQPGLLYIVPLGVLPYLILKLYMFS